MAKTSLFQRFKYAIGEISKLRSVVYQTVYGGRLGTPYVLSSSRVDYGLARQLYYNTADNYKLGAAFAKPIINTAVGFMGVPCFKSVDLAAQEVLDTYFPQWTSRMQRTHRNAMRDGDCFVMLSRLEEDAKVLYPERTTRLEYTILPPQQVSIDVDPVTFQPNKYIIRGQFTWTSPITGETRSYVGMTVITKDTFSYKYEGDVPEGLSNEERPNPWGFIPIVHFKNEPEDDELYGHSDLEPVEPFLKAYHDVMLHAMQGSKMHSTPRLKLKLKDVAQFLANNFGLDIEKIKQGEKASISLEGHELLLFTEDEDAEFIEVRAATGSAEILLKFLFYCIIDVSETPEFAFGTHTPSSHASVKEQMPVLVRRVARKREQFTEQWQLLARMVLAMTAQAEGKKYTTYETTILWDEVDPRDEKDVAEVLERVVNALNTAVQGGLISLDAAVQFLAQYVETMNDWMSDDPEVPGERERIVKTKLLLARLEEGQLLEAEAAVLSGEMQEIKDLAGAQDPFVYLIHHIHHVAARGKTAVREELHHCPLFISPEAEGAHYIVDDMRSGNRVYHVIVLGQGQDPPPDTLYDHLGNAYRIKRQTLGGRQVYVVDGLKRGQDVIWSDAEAE